MVIKSHNFAPFRRFDGTLLSYVRLSTRLRTNPSRTPKIHQNSDFLGILGTPRDTVYPWGEGANEQKTNKRKKEFVWSKQDLRRNLRLFGVLTEPCSVTYAKYAPSHEPVKNPENPSKF